MSGWHNRAACRGTPNPDAFTPEPGDWATPAPWLALADCASCPVRDLCLAEGYRGRTATGDPLQGIWGGTTDTDRELLRLQRWQPGTPRPPAHGRWLPVAEAARLLGISEEVIHLWARAGQLDTEAGISPTGQARRMVDLDQTIARRNHVDPGRLKPSAGPGTWSAA
jgi:hypothetical protein